MNLRIGTRGSRLALVQTNWVADQIRQAHPDIEIDIQVIKTKGDTLPDVPLTAIGDKGLFVREIETALLDKRIDLSVNSMKDMPAILPEGLMLSHCPKREDARDALVTTHRVCDIRELPRGAVIGTGSKRRAAQLNQLRPDIRIMDIRGNVETRIGKIEKENLDGVILAMAGLNRLGYSDEPCTVLPLPVQMMIPAPCQGILAIEIRKSDTDTHDLLACLHDRQAMLQAQIERAFLYHIEGGCHAPVGAYAQIEGDSVTLTGLFGADKRIVTKQMVCRIGEHADMGEILAGQIKKELGIG